MANYLKSMVNEDFALESSIGGLISPSANFALVGNHFIEKLEL
jgi:hypothetical protein